MQKTYHTKYKEFIMKYLQNRADTSFSAADIYAYMQGEGLQVNLTTVYRNLERLAGSNLLMKIKTAEDESCKYQYLSPEGNCQEHIHMQCRICKKLFHLECDFMRELSGHLLEHHHFVLESGGSILSGLCEACSRKGESE